MSAATFTGVVGSMIVVVLGARLGSWPTPTRRVAGAPRRAPTTWRRPFVIRRAPRRPGDVEVAAWCERVAAGVRAGSSLTRAVVDVDAATPPEHQPFSGAAHALSRGRPLARAIGTIDDGPESAVGLLAPVLTAAAELGGPVAGPLERVAGTLHARDTERQERRAASAQARLSARVLTVLPFGVLTILLVAEPSIRLVLTTPAGMACVGLGSALNGLGWWWMRRLIGGVP